MREVNKHILRVGPLFALLFSVIAQPVFAMESKFNLTNHALTGSFNNEPISKGVLLVAGQEMRDPRFKETVILVINHDPANGSVGVIINRPTNILLSNALPDLKELEGHHDTLFMGGPVSQNNLVMLFTSNSKPEEADHVFSNVYASSSIVVLNKMLTASKTMRAYAGYAGWGAGQLENEIRRGDWRVVKADEADIFDKAPGSMWRDLIGTFDQRWVQEENAGIILSVALVR